MRLSAEQALEEKLIATLEPVTGAGNVRASVTLDYDPAATEETQESYDPDQTVTLSMQRTEQTTGPQPVAAGIPGTASNAPNSQALPVYPQQTSAPQSAKSESGTYGASKTVRHVVENPGQGAAADRGDRGERPAGSARVQGQGGAMAASLGRGVAQPDRAGAGGGGLRRGARRHAARSRIWPSRKTVCSSRFRCRARCWPRRKTRRFWSSTRPCWLAFWWWWPSGCVPPCVASV